MDKFVFSNILVKKWAEALEKGTKGNVIDARVSVCNTNGSWEQTNIYGIDQLNAMYDELKDYEDWYIDFYENIAGANMAEYIDITFFSTEIPKEEEKRVDENKRYVWCVLINQVYDFEELRNDVRIFAKKEDAMAYAREFIADEMQYVTKDDWVIDDDFETKGVWESYEDGCYTHNHTTLSVINEEIIEDNQ